MLQLKNISHYYKNAKELVLDNINLEVKDQELVAIIGPSGCGKTTLVNIIAGYIKPVKGKILVHDKEVSRPGKDRIVINQENDLFNWMTVEENIKLINHENNKVNEFLKLARLVNYKDYYPHQLSGGMKKRLSLVRALAADLQFIIMDEPFSSQDVEIKNKLYHELLRIARDQNKTILLITHDIEEAIFLSDRIVVLGGKPATIIGEHKVPFRELGGKDRTQIDELKELKSQLQSLGYKV